MPSVILALILAGTLGLPLSSPSAHGSSLPDNCDPFLGVCLPHRIITNHFVVIYDTKGPFAVSDGWAMNVSAMAENSYKKLVDEDGFPAPARIPIPIYLDLLTGGFTSFTFCGGCTPRVLDLAALQIEYRVQSPCKPSCGLPTSYYTLSHEFFHTIQFTEYDGPVPLGLWFSEGSAGWAGYEVNKNESRWDPLVLSAWLGANGTTDRAPEYRSFDTAFLFAFLAEFYGGHRIMNALVSHAATNATADGLITSQLEALGYHKTFLDVMNEFGGAIVSGNFSDRDLSRHVLKTEPPIAAAATWTGSSINLTSFTNNVNGFTQGDELQVGAPFGIEYVSIRPASNRSLAVGIQVANQSCFRASLIAHSSRGYSIHALSPAMSFALASPQSYDKIYLGFTRGYCTDPHFAVTLSPAPETLYWSTSIALFGLLVAIGVSILVALALMRRSRTEGSRRQVVSTMKNSYQSLRLGRDCS